VSNKERNEQTPYFLLANSGGTLWTGLGYPMDLMPSMARIGMASGYCGIMVSQDYETIISCIVYAKLCLVYVQPWSKKSSGYPLDYPVGPG
jgi:hypothetical protein